MATGRPPKPREVRIAEGNPRQHKLPEPVPGLGKALEFPPPRGLSAAERRVWRQLIPEVAALGWIDKVDRAMLTMLVQTIARVDQARAAIRKHGFMVEHTRFDKDGNEISTELKINPAVAAADRATGQALRLAEQFGLTGSARARLGLTVAKGASIAAKLQSELGDDDDDDDTIELPDDQVTEAD